MGEERIDPGWLKEWGGGLKRPEKLLFGCLIALLIHYSVSGWL